MPSQEHATAWNGLRVNGDRLWDDLNSLSKIGRGSRGISRLAFSPEDMEGRRWLMQRFREAGVQPRMDVYGNVFGRLEGGSGETPLILMGSHIDTVPEGGMFDGALGVLAGLECLRTLKEAGIRTTYPLEVIAFANEEGSRLGPGLFGSRALFEGIGEDEWAKVGPVLKAAGIQDGSTAPVSPLVDPRSLRAYLELHIEQGGVLDSAGEDIGVVQGIVCIHSFHATFLGEANHAGTTPMHNRRDALQGAAELILAIPEIVGKDGSPVTVGTCGQVRVSPGGRNIIPGEAEISIEVRDLDEIFAGRVIEALRVRARKIAEGRGLDLHLNPVSGTAGAMMNPEIQDAIERAAQSLGLKTRRMASGAGHDAMTLGKLVPTGMIFVPSKGGISHSPDEMTSKEQCTNGAQVLLETILSLM